MELFALKRYKVRPLRDAVPDPLSSLSLASSSAITSRRPVQVIELPRITPRTVLVFRRVRIRTRDELEKTELKIYVGNLPWSIGDSDLEDLFAEHGAVESAKVIMDRDTGRSRGFGFVEMDGDSGAAAISALNGREVDSRPLKVNEAQAREMRASNY